MASGKKLQWTLSSNADSGAGSLRDTIQSINSLKAPSQVSYAAPTTINLASAGTGSSSHLAGELFKIQAGVKADHIPYKGAGPAYGDLVSGTVQMMFANMPSMLPQVRAGKLKGIAISGDRRNAILPDVPTFAESGVTEFSPVAGIGLLAPAGTPRAIVDKLSAAVQTATTQNQALAEKWSANAGELKGNTPDEFRAFIKAESVKWLDVVSRAGIKLD
mgnify:CR=1 FL=1